MGGGASKVSKGVGSVVLGPAKARVASSQKARPQVTRKDEVSASDPRPEPNAPVGELGAMIGGAAEPFSSDECAPRHRVAEEPVATVSLPAEAFVGKADERARNDGPPADEKQLLSACRVGNAGVAGSLANALGRKALEPTGPHGDTFVHVAAREGHEGVVDALIAAGLSAGKPNLVGETPLHIACRFGHGSVVLPLLNAGADAGHPDASGSTPLHMAAASGFASEDMIDALLAARADVGVVNSRGLTPLHMAAVQGATQAQRILLARGADANATTSQGTTPLMVAMNLGHLDSVNCLLRGGANPAAADATGATALAQALACGNRPAAECLLAAGASVDAVDGAGRGAVFHAVIGGDAGCLDLVIAQGGRVNTLDEEGRTPLYQSCLQGHEELVANLLAAGADPNLAGLGSVVRPPPPVVRDGEGSDEEAARLIFEESRTCAQVCALLGHTGILTRILDARVDIDAAPGALGWTALHICAVAGHAQEASLLLDRGAETSFEDSEGNTAEALAVRAGDRSAEVLQRLRKADASSTTAATEAARDVDAPADTEAAAQGAASGGSVLGPLPPLAGRRRRRELPMPTAEPPAERPAALAAYEAEWMPRESNDLLLDRIFGPMVHDALMSEHAKTRAEAFAYIAEHRERISCSGSDLLASICIAFTSAAKDRVSSVQLAALAAFAEALADSRLNDLSPEKCTTLLRGDSQTAPAEAAASCPEGKHRTGAVGLLLDLAEVSGKPSVARAAIDTLCACVKHERLALDEAAWPLLARIDVALRVEQSGEAATREERKASDGACKVLAADIKCLCQLMESFGVKRSGLFRRALLLPLFLRGVQSSNSRVRNAANDGMSHVIVLTGGLKDAALASLPPKVRTAAQRMAAEVPADAIRIGAEEDTLPKATLIAADPRAAGFECMAELASAQQASELSHCGAGDGGNAGDPFPLLTSKTWKDRAQGVAALLRQLEAAAVGADQVLGSFGAGNGTSATLLQYALCKHPLSAWGASLRALMADTVIGVFVPAADLLAVACTRAGGVAGEALLDAVLPALLARIADTSGRVRSKVVEVSACLASVGNQAYAGSVLRHICACFLEGRDLERNACYQLHLVGKIVGSASKQEDCLSTDTWSTVSACALKAGNHRAEVVRKGSAELLQVMRAAGGIGREFADEVDREMRAAAQQRVCKRPGTGARPPTSASRPGTMSRLASRGGRPTSRCGTASNFVGAMGSYGRTKTARAKARAQQVEAESDDSAPECCVEGPPAVLAKGSPDGATIPQDESGVVFFDVQQNAPGSTDAAASAEADAALQEMLLLAEPLSAEAADFVAPLVAAFGEDFARCLYSRQWQCRAAALTQLAASVAARAATAQSGGGADGCQRLVEAATRAVHEGLGDHNLRVYEAACDAVAAAVPALCGIVDGRFLVAHLAPLLQQLCARMADSKEVARTLTCSTLFLLVRPPSGEIVTPDAIVSLVLGHLVPRSQSGETDRTSGAGGAVVGWLCRIFALRDLVKQYPSCAAQHESPEGREPGEWLQLRHSMEHPDPTVRHEAARLYALVCKVAVRGLDGEESQMQAREQWVEALGQKIPTKVKAFLRRLLRLPEVPAQAKATPNPTVATATTSVATWDIPKILAEWAGCDSTVLLPLRSPGASDGEGVVNALRALRGRLAQESPPADAGRPAAETFADLCRAIQQALGSAAGAEKAVLLSAVELCGAAVMQLSAAVSGLDLNLSLTKTLQVLLARTSSSGASGVKAAVASDRLIRQLAKHPKIGCEAAAKMAAGAVGRAERPGRPLTLIGTLIADHGVRLCGQQDFVLHLMNAAAFQLERLNSQRQGPEDERETFSTRSQLTEVLAKCQQFSPDTVREVLATIDEPARSLLVETLRKAPDPKLVALGAAASEKDAMEAKPCAVGSASRALGRRRTKELDGYEGFSESAKSGAADARVGAARGLAPLQLRAQAVEQPPLRACQSLGALPRPVESLADPTRAARRSRGDIPPPAPFSDEKQRQSGASLISDVSTAASTRGSGVARPLTPTASPDESPRFGSASPGDGKAKFRWGAESETFAYSPSKPRMMQRSGSDARLLKGRGGGSWGADAGMGPMDGLRQFEGRALRCGRNPR